FDVRILHADHSQTVVIPFPEWRGRYADSAAAVRAKATRAASASPTARTATPRTKLYPHIVHFILSTARYRNRVVRLIFGKQVTQFGRTGDRRPVNLNDQVAHFQFGLLRRRARKNLLNRSAFTFAFVANHQAKSNTLSSLSAYLHWSTE